MRDPAVRRSGSPAVQIRIVVQGRRIRPGEQAEILVGRERVAYRWGMLRRFRGHGGKRGPAILAEPLAVVAKTPQLRDATPCLVIADGWIDGDRWIHPIAPGPITFAGLAETSKDDGVPSFAFVLRSDRSMPIVVTAGELIDEAPQGWRVDPIAKLDNPAQGELF